jgi:hypothetical protein
MIVHRRWCAWHGLGADYWLLPGDPTPRCGRPVLAGPGLRVMCGFELRPETAMDRMAEHLGEATDNLLYRAAVNATDHGGPRA